MAVTDARLDAAIERIPDARDRQKLRLELREMENARSVGYLFACAWRAYRIVRKVRREAAL